jgi:hypothetical protein
LSKIIAGETAALFNAKLRRVFVRRALLSKKSGSTFVPAAKENSSFHRSSAEGSS